MRDIASAVTALLAFLIPLGIYCMLLAYVNRRNKPMMIHGIWDAIGLLGAVSGFLLWTMPMLIGAFCRHVADAVDAPVLYSGLWIIYVVAAVGFSMLMVWLRAAKTMIYNVDTAVFKTLFEQTIAKLGLEAKSNRERLVLTPLKIDAGMEHAFAEIAPPLPSAANDRRFAELTVENFASMCHVTLHWRQCEPYLRRQIEDELERALEGAAPEENAAAGWFYSVSGVIFGALLMVAATILLLILFPK